MNVDSDSFIFSNIFNVFLFQYIVSGILKNNFRVLKKGYFEEKTILTFNSEVGPSLLPLTKWPRIVGLT